MLTILNYAQALVYTLMELMPSSYQQKSLRALLGLFLEATGQSLPHHSITVSASAISRFLNHYQWSVRAVIRVVRAEIIKLAQAEKTPGRRPKLQVILDLTTLEKIGKFSELGKLIRVYNGKRGLHLVVLYILVGKRRLSWGFRVYRGKGELSPIELGQRLLKTLPKTLTANYEMRVLADSAFDSIEMLKWVKKHPRISGIFGIRSDRRLASGQHVSQVCQRGQQVVLQGLNFPVTLSWYWLKRDDGTRKKRFLISTKPLLGVYITLLGRRRLQIEGFFLNSQASLWVTSIWTKYFIGGLSVDSIIFHCLLSRLLSLSGFRRKFFARLGGRGAISQRNFVATFARSGAVN